MQFPFLIHLLPARDGSANRRGRGGILALTLVLATLVIGATGATPAPARAQDTTTYHPDAKGLPMRTRLIGVFDAETGEPIDSAEVKDILTGLSARTTVTGTLLLPMDTLGTLLRIRKVGYNMATQLVANGSQDTIPITLTLYRMAQMLPTVSTYAHGVARTAADTSRRLELSGFYDRRHMGEAPTTAYVSEVQIEKWRPSHLSDLTVRTGRSWMWGCTIYIDGALTPVPQPDLGPGRVPANLNQGIDQMLSPDMVAGIEVYRSSEVPVQYNATLTPPPAGSSANAGCVTLVWTR